MVAWLVNHIQMAPSSDEKENEDPTGGGFPRTPS